MTTSIEQPQRKAAVTLPPHTDVIVVVGDYHLPLGDVVERCPADDVQMFDFVLHRLGPTATLAWRFVAARLRVGSGRFDQSLAELGSHLGVGPSGAFRAINRLATFGPWSIDVDGPVPTVTVPFYAKRMAARKQAQ